MMDEDFLIETTNNLYRLTLFFPKKEPLRYKMREIASDILASGNTLCFPATQASMNRSAAWKGSTKCSSPMLRAFGARVNSNNGNKYIARELLLNDLKVLNGFFEVVKAQQWVNNSDILVVQTKYVNLMEELEKQEWKNIKTEPKILSPRSNLGRQKKILNFLKENGKVQIQEVKQIFPEVTKRTLRRDFEQMLGQGLIKRIGERNNTCYQLKVDVA